VTGAGGTGAGGIRLWVVTDGTPGLENQCLALAEALALPATVKRVRPRTAWRALPRPFWPAPFAATAPGSDPLAPPWPDLLIASGHHSAGFSIAVRRAGAGRCFTVQIQDPHLAARHFDLVAAPSHDHPAGPNTIATLGALTPVTPARLAAAAARFGATLADLPRPLVAVLVGGSNRRYRMTAARIDRLVAALATLAAQNGAGFVVTASRRTGAANAARLRAGLAGLAARMWDGTGDNPYLGYLALADAIVVTSDSVSMATDACATGKPVHVFDLAGCRGKFRRFHEALAARGMTRPLGTHLEHWRYAPPDDTARVAAEIRRHLLG
jgi:uncharacterized protein